MGKPQKVLIISVKAGAGHLRAAEALESTLLHSFPQVHVQNINALEYANPAYARNYSGAYEKLATSLPSVWKFIYEQFEKKGVDSKTKKLAALFDRLQTRPLLDYVKRYDPDAIICTHYLPAEILGPRRLEGKLRARLCVALTDYDVHTMWIAPGVDHYFVATEEVAYALRAKGVGNAEVSVTGIPLMPVFARRYPSKPAMRRHLGLAPEPRTVLIAAGGFGLSRLEQTVRTIAEQVKQAQLLALAGRNEKLLKGLTEVAGDHPNVAPFGFMENMHELMAASDLMVSKSGGLTSSECLAMGLPMVIFNPIPGQEERNSDYLLESGVAMRANSPAHLVYKVVRLLEEPALLARMAEAARSIARPRAAHDIVTKVLAGV
jgi:processive 1,2-diacylglycerol beta-glucosyltransferase